MMLARLCVVLLVVTVASAAYTDPHCVGNRRAIVHLFEWKWKDIENECIFLSEAGYCAVQTSVATENREVLHPMRPWWERYQPVSYKIASRSGNETEFERMVRACNSLDIRIYVDVVFNQMAKSPGRGVAGTHYDSKTHSYPGVPYNESDFYEPSLCHNLTDHASSYYIRKCMSLPLPEIDQSQSHVRSIMADVLNHFIDLGVAGFRVDSAQEMFVEDLTSVYSMVKDVQWGGRPFFFSEFGDSFPSDIKISDYFDIGYVTEFHYAEEIGASLTRGNISGIENIFQSLLPSDRALLFVDNHDIQRGRGRNGSVILTHKEPDKYQQAQALTLASGYGIPRIMSSFYFNDTEAGPPHNKQYEILDVTLWNYNTCGNGWVCEHRWPVIRRAVAFSNIVRGQELHNFVTTSDTISFTRGKLGFFAMRLSSNDQDTTNRVIYTGLPQGVYCNMITNCTSIYSVDSKYNTAVNFSIEPTIALVKMDPAKTIFSTGLNTKNNFSDMETNVFQADQVVPTTEQGTATADAYFTTDDQYFTTLGEDFTTTNSYFATDGQYFVNTEEEFSTTMQNFATTEGDVATTQEDVANTDSFLTTEEKYLATIDINFASTEPNLETTIEDQATRESYFTTDGQYFATTVKDATTDGEFFSATDGHFTTDGQYVATTEKHDQTTGEYLLTTNGEYFGTSEETITTTQASIVTTENQSETTAQETTPFEEITTEEPLLTTDTMNEATTTTTELTTKVTITTTEATLESSTPTPNPWRRTVILMERQTSPGQDVFIRGGIDFGHMSGCQHFDQGSNPCAIPLRHRPLKMRDPTPARDAWTYGDNYLDWDGTEPGQGTFNNGWIAQGTPAQWTTNDPYRMYYNPLNTYGDHYWLVDVDMDCSKTYNGFFEFKAVVNNGWENGQYLDTQCHGNGGIPLPYHSDNHFGRCGFVNIYHWNSGDCIIKEFPNGVEVSPIIG